MSKLSISHTSVSAAEKAAAAAAVAATTPELSVAYAFDAVQLRSRTPSPLIGVLGAQIDRAPSPAGACSQSLAEFTVTVIVPADRLARKPVGVALTVDVSGSMAENMEAVVAAVAFVVGKLAPGDFFAVQVFSDDVRTLVPPQAWTAAGAAAAVHKLAACAAEGLTNLAAATSESMAAAAAMVQMAGAAPNAVYLSPIAIVVTDGHPTERFGGPLEIMRRVLRQGAAPAAAESDTDAAAPPAKRPRPECELGRAERELALAELEADAAPRTQLSVIGIGTDLNWRLTELMVRAGGGVLAALTGGLSAEALSAALGAIVGGAASVTHPDLALAFEPGAACEFAWELNGRAVGAQSAGAPGGAPGGPPMAGGPAGSFTAGLPPLAAGASISGLLRAAPRHPHALARGGTLGRVWVYSKSGGGGCAYTPVRLPARASLSPVPDPLARWLARRPALLAAIRDAIAAYSDDAGADDSLAPTLAELTSPPLLGYGPADQLATLVRKLQAGPAAGDAGFVAHAFTSLSQLSGASSDPVPLTQFARTMSQGL
jgi:hypothetical protein